MITAGFIPNPGRSEFLIDKGGCIISFSVNPEDQNCRDQRKVKDPAEYKVLLCNPATYEIIRKATNWIAGTEIGANFVIRGTVGMIHGCQVVVSNKLTAANAAYIVKPGALAIYNKRDILVETDRDIINKSTVITADRHAAVYILDKTKLIKMPGQASTT